MKMKFIYIICLLPVVIFSACKFDNYAPPKSTFSGALVYKGDSVRVGFNQVTFELWQSGFGKMTPINVNVAQNGSFSALLYDGNYKLIIPAGQGPFMSEVNATTNSDTIQVNVKGNKTMNIDVLPYYMIRNPQFSLSDSTVTATCKLEKIISDANAKDIESVSLYLSKTTFVDNRTSINTTTLIASDITDMNNVSLSVKVPSMIPTQHYVFARIGLKISGVEDMIFSPIEKVQL